MRVIQVLPIIAFGDAIGNHTIALKKIICEMGYETEVYAEVIDSRLPKGTAVQIEEMPKLDDNDIIIYHLSTGGSLNRKLVEWNGHKIINYHNITPPHFFRRFNFTAQQTCEKGIEDAYWLRDKVDYCLADSEFNKENLLDMGYDQNIDVLPIVIPFHDYEKLASAAILKKFDDDYVNILFTGRIAPNKKQEDIIQAFYYYKKFINKKSRLFFIGTYTGMEKYYNRLQEYVDTLELDDIHFTGHIKFDEILAYYRLADVFVCMSEHEGFCVPLVEAMFFNTPIVAYDKGAVAGTMMSGGLLLKEKNPKLTAEAIHRLVCDDELREKILLEQEECLKRLQYEVVSTRFKQYLQKYIGGIK